MSPVEEPVVVLLPVPAANGETSNEGDEAVDRRVFSEGPCSHQAKKNLVKNKNWKETIKKDKTAKGKKCMECVRKSEKDATVKVVEESHTICLTCGRRLCELHAIEHSKAARSGDEHPFYYDQDEDSVRCFSCEVIVEVSNAPHVTMVLNELKSLWKMKGKDEKATGDKGTTPTEEKPTVLDKPDIKTENNPEKKPNQNGTASPDDGKKANGFKKTRAAGSAETSSSGYENGAGAGEKTRNGLGLAGTTAIPAKGLSNLGNTCFFNSVMQCMLHTHQLAFYCEKFGRVTRLSFPKQARRIPVNDEKVEIEEATLKIRDSSTPLNDALRSFLVDFRNGRTPSPSNLFSQISNKAARFRSMAQQDAHELLRYLLDGLCSEETGRYQEAIANLLDVPIKSYTKVDPKKQAKAKAYLLVAGRPLLDAVFGGSLLQTIKCSQCAHVSIRYENLYDLSVPLTGTDNRSAHRSANGKQRLLPDHTQSSSSDSPSTKPLSKHQQKKERRVARKNSRTLKTQTSKTGEEEASIETKMAEMRLEGETGETSDEEAEEKAEEAKDAKEAKEKKEVKSEPESSGNEDDSYRPEEKNVHLLDSTKALTTMKTPLPSGQSIAASLLEFTAEERLEGSNAYECEKCCADVNKKKNATGAAKKRVEAIKRYLIVTPPVVLTIHVKRFQQTHMGMRMSTRKVSGHVHFPLIFDIAPFCCKNVERISPGQSSILYSLYGVVSHSGNLSGGHYVAYVKSREKIERTEEMLEAARAICADAQAEPTRPAPPQQPLKPEDAAKDVPAGQWYYCSDSRVSAISESKVLSEEAYLLFYERIY